MPSGRLDSATPASRDTLTPPWRTVSPSTNDSGTPSRTEPSTMARGDPSAWAPVATAMTTAMTRRLGSSRAQPAAADAADTSTTADHRAAAPSAPQPNASAT